MKSTPMGVLIEIEKEEEYTMRQEEQHRKYLLHRWAEIIILSVERDSSQPVSLRIYFPFNPNPKQI